MGLPVRYDECAADDFDDCIWEAFVLVKGIVLGGLAWIKQHSIGGFKLDLSLLNHLVMIHCRRIGVVLLCA
jgi:hypothetical protein